jgi:hypothetical protein
MSPLQAESEPRRESEKDVGVPNGAAVVLVGVLRLLAVVVLSSFSEPDEVGDDSSPELLKRQLSCMRLMNLSL